MHHDLQFAFKTVSNWSLFRLVYITLTTITSARYTVHPRRNSLSDAWIDYLLDFSSTSTYERFLFLLCLWWWKEKKKKKDSDVYTSMSRNFDECNEVVSKISKLVERGEIDRMVSDFSITDRRFLAIDSRRKDDSRTWPETRPQTIKASERTQNPSIRWPSLYLTPPELIRKTFRLEAHWFTKHRPIRLRRTGLVCLQL